MNIWFYVVVLIILLLLIFLFLYVRWILSPAWLQPNHLSTTLMDTSTSYSLSLTWSAVPSTLYYSIYLSPTPHPSSTRLVGQTSSLNFKIVNLDYEQTYYIAVLAVLRESPALDLPPSNLLFRSISIPLANTHSSSSSVYNDSLKLLNSDKLPDSSSFQQHPVLSSQKSSISPHHQSLSTLSPERIYVHNQTLSNENPSLQPPNTSNQNYSPDYKTIHTFIFQPLTLSPHFINDIEIKLHSILNHIKSNHHPLSGLFDSAQISLSDSSIPSPATKNLSIEVIDDDS